MMHSPTMSSPAPSDIGTSVTPLKFSLTSFIGADTYRDEQFLSCEASRAESAKLAKRLFDEQIVLRNALEQLELHFHPMGVNCFDVQGQFDHAVCLLRLNKLGPSRFLIQTSFYKDNRLICTTRQDGVLASKDEECV